MAIKVKHDGGASSAFAAGLAGGAGKRRAQQSIEMMKTAAQQSMNDQRIAAELAAAQMRAGGGGGGGGGGSAPHLMQASAGGAPHAQIISAPTGAGGAWSAPQRAAPGIPARPKEQIQEPDFIVTGKDPNERPDDRSVWNPQTQQWERGKVAYQNWLGGMGDERRGGLAADSDQRRMMQGMLDSSARAQMEEAADARKLANWKEQYTFGQRAEIDNLNAMRDEIMNSDRYTPEEKKDLQRQIDAKILGIQPATRPKTPEEIERDQFDPAKSFAENTYTDEAGNVYGYNPKNQAWTLINAAKAEKPQPDAIADEYNAVRGKWEKSRDNAYNSLINEMVDGDTVGSKKPKYTHEQALAEAEKRADMLYPLPQFKSSAEKKQAEEAAENMRRKLSGVAQAFRSLFRPPVAQPAAPQPQAQPQPAPAQPQPADSALLNPGLADATDFGPGAAQPIPAAPGGPAAPDSQVLQPMARQPAAPKQTPKPETADEWMEKAKKKGWLVQPK